MLLIICIPLINSPSSKNLNTLKFERVNDKKQWREDGKFREEYAKKKNKARKGKKSHKNLKI